MNKHAILFLLLIAASQAGAWFQQFSQFKWEWFKHNQWFNTFILGIFLSIGFVNAARIGYGVWESAWTVRLVQFSVGIFVVSILNSFLLGEGINLKTMVCLVLSFVIIFIQVFWK